jgi:glucuronosyltransferase
MVASIYFIYQQDLRTFLDEAEDGVIYFSLGTLVLGETLPEDKVQAFISVFSELPQRVLWRMDKNVSLPNVKTSKWFPQLDVLSKLYK